MQIPFPTTQLSSLPHGSAGTRATLRLMGDFIERGKTHMLVRDKALKLTEFLPSKAWESEARAIFHFVRDKIRYVRDVDGVETLAEPQVTLQYAAGDCDDKAILAGALLQAIGHPVKLVAVGFRGQPFSHVYIETLMGDPRDPAAWRPMELTEALPFGVAPPNATSRMEHHVPLR